MERFFFFILLPNACFAKTFSLVIHYVKLLAVFVQMNENWSKGTRQSLSFTGLDVCFNLVIVGFIMGGAHAQSLPKYVHY